MTKQQEDQVVTFLRDHHHEFDSQPAALTEAFTRAGVSGLTANSGAVQRYFVKAGLRKPRGSSPDANGPIASIHAAERQIVAALRELDAERDLLMNKIRELDNIAAKYKSFGGTQ